MKVSKLRSITSGVAATSLTLLSFGSIANAGEKPREVTVGYLNLVNAQLVTKNLGLVSITLH